MNKSTSGSMYGIGISDSLIRGNHRWLALAVVAGLHVAAAWGLWNTHIRVAMEQHVPLFVSLINPPASPKPPAPKPAAQPARMVPNEPPPEPKQIVAQAPVTAPEEFTAPPAPVPEAAEPPPAPAAPVPPKRIALPDLAITCPEKYPPSYPLKSKRSGEQGKVILQVFLDETGHIMRAVVNRSSGSPTLDEAALQAIHRWNCKPATRDGQPVPAVALQPFNFVLN